MQRLQWLTLFIVAFLVGCSEQPREEVIQRYAGGEKRVVAVYVGRGSEEQMIERRTYDLTGDILLLEDLENGTTLEYMALHPDLSDSDGLEAALQGRWYRAEHEGVGTYTEKTSDGFLDISGSRFVSHSRGGFLEFGDGWEFESTGEISFLDSAEVEFTYDEVDSEESPEQDPEFEIPPMRDYERIVFHDRDTFTITSIVEIDNRILFKYGFVERFHRDEAVAAAEAVSWSNELALDPDADPSTTLIRLADIVRDDAQLLDRYPEWHADVLEQAEEIASIDD